jgi:ankyrin repeat protein
VRRLLAAGADASLDSKKVHGGGPLYAAAQNGHRETVAALCAAGAAVDAPNWSGATPAFIAAARGHAACLAALIAAGADLEAADEDGRTPAFAAARHGRAEALRVLRDAGADLLRRRPNGAGPTFAAAAAGRLETLRLLLAACGAACVDAANANGATPLMVAVRCGDASARVPAARALLDAGADVGAAMGNGDTALHVSARRGDLAVLRLLLARGADPLSANALGRTALDGARDQGLRDAASLLEAAEARARGGARS